MSHWPDLLPFIEQGFALDIGPWPDTPLQPGDVLLAQDPAGHLLIARAPRPA